MKIHILFVVASILLVGCLPGIGRLPQDDSVFEKGVVTGKMDKRVREASGITYSIKNPGMLWVINDSGNEAKLFLMTPKGEIKKEFHLPIPNRDWEALSVFYDQSKGTSFLFIGDVGDNLAGKQEKSIYWLEEPEFFSTTDQMDDVHALNIGLKQALDMEAILIDPLTKDVLLLSKREDSVRLYKTDRYDKVSTSVLQEVCRLPFTYVVDIAMSPDGNELLLKDYRNVFYWKRQKNTAISQTLLSPPVVVSYERERQGEALCYDRENLGYYTVSESGFLKHAKIFYYKRKIKNQ